MDPYIILYSFPSVSFIDFCLNIILLVNGSLISDSVYTEFSDMCQPACVSSSSCQTYLFSIFSSFKLFITHIVVFFLPFSHSLLSLFFLHVSMETCFSQSSPLQVPWIINGCLNTSQWVQTVHSKYTKYNAHRLLCRATALVRVSWLV